MNSLHGCQQHSVVKKKQLQSHLQHELPELHMTKY